MNRLFFRPVADVCLATLVLSTITATQLSAQSAAEITPQAALFYMMKVYSLTPATTTFQYPVEMEHLGRNFLDYYVRMFDSTTFQRRSRNEFDRTAYFETMARIMADSISAAPFDRAYQATIRATLAEYSFADSAFPIQVDEQLAPRLLSMENLGIYGAVDNWYYFHFHGPGDARGALRLPMSQGRARSFIAERTAPNGVVDRRVLLRVTYSVLNHPLAYPCEGAPCYVGDAFSQGGQGRNLGGLGRNLPICVLSIDVVDPGRALRPLSTLFPDSLDPEAVSTTQRRLAAQRQCDARLVSVARASTQIIGTWQTPTGTFQFHENKSFSVTSLGQDTTVTGTWAVDGDDLVLTLQSLITQGRTQVLADVTRRSRILYVDSSAYVMRDPDRGTLYHAARRQ